MNFVAVLLASVAVAGVPVDSIAKALEGNPVYVESGAAGATTDTLGVLGEQLRSGDNIVVVMLASSDAEPASVSAEINSKLGGKKIIGLSVGEKVVGYSTVLPAGVASELMVRASTVATTTEETLGTYIQNVHDWQRAHPAAVASKPTESGGRGALVVIGVLVIVFLVLGTATLVGIARSKGRKADAVRLKKSPEPVREELNELLAVRTKILSPDVAATITQICRDTEAFFQRSKADTSDTEVFKGHLQSLNQVMTQYVDIQNNPRYFEDSSGLLGNGADAASSFADYVLEAVRRDGRRGLTEFHVDTDILSAQRYR